MLQSEKFPSEQPQGYDANSNLLTKTDARGISTTYAYDELNRVTQKNHSDSTPPVSYYYVGPGTDDGKSFNRLILSIQEGLKTWLASSF
jgi:YD repeat-containing protein